MVMNHNVSRKDYISVGNQVPTVRKDRQTDKPGRTEGQTVESGHSMLALEQEKRKVSLL